jgi:hypothetical protein
MWTETVAWLALAISVVNFIVTIDLYRRQREGFNYLHPHDRRKTHRA